MGGRKRTNRKLGLAGPQTSDEGCVRPRGGGDVRKKLGEWSTMSIAKFV